MEIIAGIILLSLAATAVWLVRPRDGEMIPLLSGESRQFAVAICLMLMFFASTALIIFGLSSVTWR